jgi:hypothetical protein
MQQKPVDATSALTSGFPVTGSVPLHVPAAVSGFATPCWPGARQGAVALQQPLPSFAYPLPHVPVPSNGVASGPPLQAASQQKPPMLSTAPGFTYGFPVRGSLPVQVPVALFGTARGRPLHSGSQQ